MWSEGIESLRQSLKRELRYAFRQHGQSILSVVSSMLAERDQRTPIGIEGMVIAGSYDPSDDTVQVIRGDSYALLQDDGSEPVAPLRLPLLSTSVDDQHGPGFVGDQSAVILPTQGGGMVMLHRRPDTSRQTPVGERWIGHRNAAGDIDVDDRHTNDAASAGDGLGGKHILAGGRFTAVTTGGLQIQADDTAGTIVLAGKNGATVTLNADGSITLTSSENVYANGPVVLGANSAGAGDEIVRKADLQNAITALAAKCAAGSGVPPPTATGSTNSRTT